MENCIYIRKNEIFDKKIIEDIIKPILRKKENLENDFLDIFSAKFVKVKYKDEYFYYDKDISVLYPVFEEIHFQKIGTAMPSMKEIKEYFPEKLKNKSDLELMTKSEYKSSFFNESKKIVKQGKILTLNQCINNFAVWNNDNQILEYIDEKMEKADEGYIIPVVRFEKKANSIEIKEIISFFEENQIEPVFEKEKIIERYEILKNIYKDLRRYNIDSNKLLDFNLKELLLDIDKGKYYYSIDEYKEKLLNIEKERIDTDKYDEGIFLDSQRGHWDLFYNESEENIEKKEMIKIKTNEKIYSRNPEKDIRSGGTIAIDFGTKSTVVAFQEENDKTMLMRIGGGSYKKEVEENQYENPTVMEFLDIESFIKDYNSFAGRPFTKWEDLKISYSAVSDFIGGSISVIEGLKQWCGNKNEKIIIYDSKGKKIYLSPYLELKEDDIDPIEIYAYYIGSYINNMHTGSIFMDYLLSFPITYEKEIRDRILKSFEKGIKKSLPVAVLKNEKLMETFKVTNGTNEPTAYFLCAVNEYGLNPQTERDKLFYGVFDFGGGTTDFDFGIYKKSSLRRYDYILEHFGEGGDRYLGGENILRILSYEVFKINKEKLQNKNITFYCPEKCEKFNGYENLLVVSYESKYNMRQMCEKLRDFWERPDEAKEEYQSEKIKISLLNRNGEREEGIELEIDTDILKEKIKNLIEEGIDNFFKALMLAIHNNNLTKDIEKINIFLSGNSSKNIFVKEIFNTKIKEYEKEMELKEGEKVLFLYPPLGTSDALKIQSNSQINNILNGKTGTAYGLLKTRIGGKIKIKAVDEIKNSSEINFKYYVGYSSNNYLINILDYKTGYNKWVEFMDASEKISDIYYSDVQNTIDNSISTSDSSVRRKRIIIDNSNDEAMIFIRAKNTDTIEYTVAYKNEIEEGKFLEEIKELKL